MQLSYFGKNFHGWQIQPNADTVQEQVNKVFSTLLNTEIYVVGAGRTDTGVHAKDMWAHWDYDGDLPSNFIHKANRFIGRDIAFKKVIKVGDTAHCRFDALSRAYEYHIRLNKDPFEQEQAWHVYFDLNVAKMQEAADVLFEFKDFSSFSRSKTQTKTNICTIMMAEWEEKEDALVFRIKADRFLRNMVRAIVGTLVQVGQGKLDIEDFREIIENKDRTAAGESAPAHGLFLTEVAYPKEILNGK